MSLQDKLQHFTAPADAFVVGIEGAVTGDAVVDAHLKALEAGRRLVLVHTGTPTAVALRMAARFQATLIDAASIVLPERERILALPPHVDALVSPQPPQAPPPFQIELERSELVLAASDPAPEVAHTPNAPALLEEGHLPWEIMATAPDTLTLTLPDDEFESMPWNVVHHQIIVSGRSTRLDAPRPTTVPDWGLPWPRPAGLISEGLSVADPKLWHARERLGAIREDLDRAGAPSFGSAKPPEGSTWLKRLNGSGSL
jgi:hypothetical protein